jgi:ABC-2 type transport system permease protein
MFINILLYSIQFPLYYKFGFVKMRIFSNLVYIFFIIGLSTLCENISKNPEILAFIKAVHPVILSVVLIAAMIFMLIISAEISIRFYITREC